MKRMVDGDGNGNEKRQDLVDNLLDIRSEKNTNFILHRDVIKVAIMDLFAAGTDTTSTTIEWEISELIRHPRKNYEEVTERGERSSSRKTHNYRG
ncbi:putative cytochrome P450 [Helianthus annuus]|nr:putative cytochrome P450 [Helianthus annuus]KAJ0756431.1 putative cytochrome P450 [Helianthus annuus]KAJ0760194.1 putative cytochrome P450 [Helianthus annuus]